MSVLLIFLFALCVAALLRKVGSREAGLPPGPPTVPVLGNVHIFPTEFAYFKFTEWARKYGGIFSLKVGPSTVVVLTDVAAVKELLDKRSATTGDRPPIHLADCMTGGLQMALARSTPTYKILRKTSGAILTAQATAQHLPIQQAEATQLLYDILRTPQSFYTDISRYSFSVIRSVLYGKRAPRYDTPEISGFFNVLHEFNAILSPGAAPPVDAIPILKFVPERWAKWKRECKRIRNLQRTLYFGMMEETRDRMRRGEGNGCYMEEVVGRAKELGMDDEMASYFGSALQETGSETTSSYLQSLILALVAYPEAQKKAHEEIDRVVGEDRLPTLDDLGHMPYIRAMISETHRFRPVAPLGVPHSTLASEEYQGYLIPKGATIFVNVWGIFHDPALFDDPENFVPERYMLTENGTKPGIDGSDLKATFPFGFGRRICPGMHLAFNSININAMNLLWAFDFKPDIDADGKPITVDTAAYVKGITTAPLPFKCRITPRSTAKAKIIEREFLDAADTFAKFEIGLNEGDKEYAAKSRAYAG
ncbi:putative cytochrome P450 [Mycena venus]|uniref:Putative cytochrome P450 n=1 Tax=Mycena venus TaxID=2733690 RepID=A0A8H6X363_9AGAR|nr:putative cytochrome P450 [Mycena venus]